MERRKKKIKIKGRSVPRDRTFHSVALANEKERKKEREEEEWKRYVARCNENK